MLYFRERCVEYFRKWEDPSSLRFPTTFPFSFSCFIFRRQANDSDITVSFPFAIRSRPFPSVTRVSFWKLFFRVEPLANGRGITINRDTKPRAVSEVYLVTFDPWSRGRARSNAAVRVKNRDAAISATDWFILSFVALLKKTPRQSNIFPLAGRWGNASEWTRSSVVSTDFHSIQQVAVNQRNCPTVSPVGDFSNLISLVSPSVNFRLSKVYISRGAAIRLAKFSPFPKRKQFNDRLKIRPGLFELTATTRPEARRRQLRNAFRKLQDVSFLAPGI